ncbi:MFS transporter [Kitasatospora sp. NBC_00458]|uniref:MFS transporter n=1 Tax=Kitasatospora sp. NBC_00458 TaxID=2903568 RepID=UPI002E16DD61
MSGQSTDAAVTPGQPGPGGPVGTGGPGEPVGSGGPGNEPGAARAAATAEAPPQKDAQAGEAPAGPSAAVRRRESLIVGLACLGQFMVVLDVSIVNVALPAIRDSLHFASADLPWVVNAYTLALAGFMLLGGRAADLFGRRRMFLVGVVAFTAASVVGGLAPSAGVLVAARAVQGLGAAVLAPCTLTIITTTFTEGPRRTRAIATWSMVGAVGGAVGAIAGGLLTDYLSWRWVLLVNLPIGLAVVVGTRLWLPADRGNAGRKLDVPGAVTVSAGLTALVYGIVQADKDGWGATGTLLPIVAGLVLLGLFVLIQARLASEPLLPLRLLGVWQRSGANLVMFLLGAGFFSLLYFVSIYLQNVRDFSPIETGLVFVPHTVATVVGAKSAARMLGRGVPAPWLIISGLVASAAGFLWQAQLDATGSVLLWVVAPGSLVFLGIGLALTPVAMTATSGVPGADAGIASGLANAARQIGGSFGLVVLTGIASAHTRSLLDGGEPAAGSPELASALTSGFSWAFVSAAAILALCILVTLTLPRPPRRTAAS